jgi:hypothetical protein
MVISWVQQSVVCHMKIRRHLFASAWVLCLTPVGAFSQKTVKPSSADTAWLAVTAVATPASSASKTTVQKTAADVQAAAQQFAAQQKSIAQSARDFYVTFPADARVPQAKKLEATSLLLSTWPTPADRGKAAFQTAVVYANDTTNPPKDRFEVSALLAAQQFKIQRNGRALSDDPVAHEKAADRLFAEFGATPQSFDYYLRIADAADAETSNRVARRVASAPASAAQKKQAQVAIDRHALVGKPLSLTLKSADGKALDLRQAGKVTVLYVWSAQHSAADWAALARAKQAAPPNTEWVCVALDTTAAELAQVSGKAPAKSTHCVLNQTQRAELVKALKVRRLPFVYVVEGKGNLAGYGRPMDLPTLLASVNR